MTNKEILTGDPFATTLIVLIIDRYTTEALSWDIETIKMELEEDFRISLSDETINKIAVGIQILTTDNFITSLPDFIHFCNILSGDEGLPGVFDPADAYEVAWGVGEASLLYPISDEENETFDPEIIGYITEVLKQEDILTPPDTLAFIPSEELVGDVINSFTDQELMQVCYNEALDKSQELQDYVNRRMQALCAELQQLQLRNGNVKPLFAEKTGGTNG